MKIIIIMIIIRIRIITKIKGYYMDCGARANLIYLKINSARVYRTIT
jgi:hypothetical protein